MADDNHNNDSSFFGITGSLKFLAAIALGAVGVLAILLVLDVLPREVFSLYLVKALSIVGILAAVSASIALLLRAK